MSVRFDEVELLKEPELPPAEPIVAEVPIVTIPAVSQGIRAEPPIKLRETTQVLPAPRFHRSLAFLTDISLFLALSLALSPLLPPRVDWEMTLVEEWPTLVALGAFLLLFSYHYFVMSWLIWGKTVGGAIFDVRVVSTNGAAMTVRSLSRRWLAMGLSILLVGLGFLLALLPGGRSLADRVSKTRSIVA